MVFGFVLLFALSAGVVTPKPSALRTMYRVCAVNAAFPEAGPAACVKLVRSEPFPPDESPMPAYPEPAKATQVEGDVSFHFEVGSGCATEEIKIDDGPEMLRSAVEDAVKNWKYCGVPEGQEIHATIAFLLNCPAQ